MDDKFFGPPLPPKVTEAHEHVENKEKERKVSEIRKRKQRCSDSSSSGTSDSSSDSSSSSSEDSASSTPKHSQVSSNDAPALKIYGPTLQPTDVTSDFIGPVMPAGFLADGDENAEDRPEWGPTPPTDGDSVLESTAAQIERRAERMKNRLLNPDEDVASVAKPERETWMTELPPEHGKNFGLAARKFSMAPVSDNRDRSGWTDMPADHAKKEQGLLSAKQPKEKISNEMKLLAQRDLEYSHQIEEYNKAKNRSKSLLELHSEKETKKHTKNKKEKHKEQKKKKKSAEKEKKKKEKKEKVPERRPFDRDVDLKTNHMDCAQKQAIIKRSQQLTGRFGHGNTTGKFL